MRKRLYGSLLLAGILVVSVAASASRVGGESLGKNEKITKVEKGSGGWDHQKRRSVPEPGSLLAIGSSALVLFELIRRRVRAQHAV